MKLILVDAMQPQIWKVMYFSCLQYRDVGTNDRIIGLVILKIG